MSTRLAITTPLETKAYLIFKFDLDNTNTAAMTNTAAKRIEREGKENSNVSNEIYFDHQTKKCKTQHSNDDDHSLAVAHSPTIVLDVSASSVIRCQAYIRRFLAARILARSKAAITCQAFIRRCLAVRRVESLFHIHRTSDPVDCRRLIDSLVIPNKDPEFNLYEAYFLEVNKLEENQREAALNLFGAGESYLDLVSCLQGINASSREENGKKVRELLLQSLRLFGLLPIRPKPKDEESIKAWNADESNKIYSLLKAIQAADLSERDIDTYRTLIIVMTGLTGIYYSNLGLHNLSKKERIPEFDDLCFIMIYTKMRMNDIRSG